MPFNYVVKAIDAQNFETAYAYDGAGRVVQVTDALGGVTDGTTVNYTYDLAGNLLSDGTHTYTYDLQNRLLTKTGADGTTAYEYDAAGNLIKETSPDGTTQYSYNAQNRLILGEKDNGESSAYTYNALGVRIENVQIRANENRGYENASLSNGSRYIKDYTKAFSDNRATWQRSWETEIGTVVQNDFETVTRHYISDYLSVANRDILVIEDGSFVVRYVYDESGKRLSSEFDYADGTARGAQNANGEYGENPASDIAVNDIGKVWYRTSLLNSTLYAVDKDGETVAHMIYDAWGKPLIETYADANFSGLENLNNFTGYTWDETLGLYFAQNRFYDPTTHRFTQEDIIKDGSNWYVYCANSPVVLVDMEGFMPVSTLRLIEDAYIKGIISDDKIGSVVILANILSLSTDFLHKVKSVLSLNVRDIYDMFVGVDEELRHDDISIQSIYVAFHETAQIVAAKQISQKHKGTPVLEALNDQFKEMDIALREFVWEVKPGYTSQSGYTRSLKKYVDNYSPDKKQDEYSTASGLLIPGGFFDPKTIDLFSAGGKSVRMSVRWVGLGRIGYFFQIKCGQNEWEPARANEIAQVLLPAFKKAEDVNTVTVLGSALLAFLVTLASPIPGDEAAAAGALNKFLAVPVMP